MISINIIAIGKNKDPWVEESIRHYLKFLQKYARVNILVIPDKSKSAKLPPLEITKLEASQIRSKIESKYVIALSEKGRKFDSEQFASFLEKTVSQGGGKIDFLIGGAFGLHDDLIHECSQSISLSPLTFSHQLVRPILLEQLYRAFTIIHGEKYHK